MYSFIWLKADSPIIYLLLEKAVLASNELNVVECTIASGQPENISLWKNGQLLAQTNETYLQYEIMPSQFGTFSCQAGNVSNSSLVLEIGKKNKIIYIISRDFSPLTRQLLFYFQLSFNYSFITSS